MKKIITIFTVILSAVNVFAQSPLKMSYQAVVRHTDGTLVTSSPVSMRISILQSSETGTAVYAETHTCSTNENGLVTCEIGNGTFLSGNLNTINWLNGPYFIKTETDPTGGTNYTISGVSQLMSVPYALYAEKAGNAGISTLGATGSNPNSNGATLTGTQLNLEPASPDFGGIVTTDAQSFSGTKHFYSPVTTEGTLTVGNDFSGSGRVNIMSNNNEFSDPVGVQLKISSYVKTFTGAADTTLPFYSVADIDASYLGVSNGVTFTDAAALHLTAPWGGGFIHPWALKTEGSVLVNGSITSGAVTYPNYDGVGGQVLTTDGNGAATWKTPMGRLQTVQSGENLTLSVENSGSIIPTQWSLSPLFPEDLPVGFNCTIINYSNYTFNSNSLSTARFYNTDSGWNNGTGTTSFSIPSGGTVKVNVVDIDGQRCYFLSGNMN